mmetsp:Transcript_94923/g.142196  ORF Transcript_94923/g.142196 Transcript_94923/m.142196 type:complete len:94 (-) Transcript_94923:1063-1344(-)
MATIVKHFQMTLIIRNPNLTGVDLDDLLGTQLDPAFAGIYKPDKMEIVAVKFVQARPIQEVRFVFVPSERNFPARYLENCDGAMGDAKIVGGN